MRRICINRKNLLYNLNCIKQKTNKKICAVVKANAYGHGLEIVSNLLKNKVDYFAVANIFEALKVREIDKFTKIIILGVCEDVSLAINNNISITIFDLKSLENAVKIAEKLKKIVNIHIKIDTGMNRLGFKDLKDFKIAIKLINNKYINFEGIYTHFSFPKNKNLTIKQYNNFCKYLKLIPSLYSPLIHLGGSSILEYNFNFDMVRVGKYLYGYGNNIYKKALRVESKIISVKKLNQGEFVSYDNSYLCQDDTFIAVVPLGYADGVPENLNGMSVKIKSKHYQIIGRVCMDMFMIKCDESVEVGDKVVILENADIWAKFEECSFDQILTNFNSFRGKRIVE